MFFKLIENGYIIALGICWKGNISEDEYNEIKELAENMPTAPTGYIYKLCADNLEWELVEVPPIDPEPLTDEEALTRYANTLTGANDPDLISAAETLIRQRLEASEND